MRVSSTQAWQLGWQTSDSDWGYGVESWQEVVGEANFAAVTGFTDYPNGCWNTIETALYDDGSYGYIAFENICSTYQVTGNLCNTASQWTSYAQSIYWGGYGGWTFSSGCGGSYTPSETPGESENGAMSVDMMEAGSGDFGSGKAFVEFNPSLHYLDTSWAWEPAEYVVTYNNGYAAPSTLGADYSCSTPWLAIDSDYAPPWYSGSWVCP